MSLRSMGRIQKTSTYKQYKIRLLHELNEDNPDRRMQFCGIMMEMSNIESNFFNNILFSEEATFCLNVLVNTNNCRYWSTGNLHWLMEHHIQHPQKLNTQAGIVGQRIIVIYKLTAKPHCIRHFQSVSSWQSTRYANT